jgi:hypothetical protein
MMYRMPDVPDGGALPGAAWLIAAFPTSINDGSGLRLGARRERSGAVDDRGDGDPSAGRGCWPGSFPLERLFE